MNNTHSNKIGQKIFVFLLSAIIALSATLYFRTETVSAAASHSFMWTYKGKSNGNFTIVVSGYKKGTDVRIKVKFGANVRVTIWDSYHYKRTTIKNDPTAVYIDFTYTGGTMNISGSATGTNITASVAKVTRVSGEVPAVPKKKKPAKKKAAKKKPTPTKKPVVKKKTTVKKTVGTKATTATTVTETTQQESIVPAVAGGDGTEGTTTTVPVPTEEEKTPVAANLDHNETGKNKKSFVWLWFVLLLAVAGLVYLRIRALRNQGKEGKDLVLDFIPGVGDLFYAFSGSTFKHEPIASDTQHGYSYNPAAGKKEIKMLEEAEKKELKAAAKPGSTAHAPIKRPKELSVNHAAVASQTTASAPAPSIIPSMAATGAVAGSVSRNDNNKPSPFKKVEGLERPNEVNPNEVFNTEVSRPNEKIMTSAFKPSTGSHTTDKIVSSAFKPAAGAHNNSDKIVSSAFKQTNKFTPQKGPAAAGHADTDAMKLARERAEAAREQQEMREAMNSPKSAPAPKSAFGKKAQPAPAAGAAKPHAPIKRPSAFSVNHAAVVAAAKAEAEKPANAAPVTAKPSGSGASLGVGASAAKAPMSGPSISPARAKASSNSNQLGNLLNGKAHNGGRAPVWAAPGTAGISPFKQTAEAQEEAKAEEAAMEAAHQAALEEAPKASYADTVKTHKSAFFSRASASKSSSQSTDDGSANAYGSIVRPSSAAGEADPKRANEPAMGAVLEGQRPSIMDPNSKAAPTADKPVFGFKPVDSQG